MVEIGNEFIFIFRDQSFDQSLIHVATEETIEIVTCVAVGMSPAMERRFSTNRTI